MKKILALVIASGALLAATPVFACPNSDGDKQETADTTKKAPANDGTTAKAKDKAPATNDAKAADKSKPAPAPKAAAKG